MCQELRADPVSLDPNLRCLWIREHVLALRRYSVASTDKDFELPHDEEAKSRRSRNKYSG